MGNWQPKHWMTSNVFDLDERDVTNSSQLAHAPCKTVSNAAGQPNELLCCLEVHWVCSILSLGLVGGKITNHYGKAWRRWVPGHSVKAQKNSVSPTREINIRQKRLCRVLNYEHLTIVSQVLYLTLSEHCWNKIKNTLLDAMWHSAMISTEYINVCYHI
jgi:hypothetical protein